MTVKCTGMKQEKKGGYNDKEVQQITEGKDKLTQ
jgi:hypothetical protein